MKKYSYALVGDPTAFAGTKTKKEPLLSGFDVQGHNLASTACGCGTEPSTNLAKKEMCDC